MTLTRGIILPSARPAGGGILDQARPLSEGWTRGVEFATEACIAAGEHVFCTDSPTAKEFQTTSLSSWTPYGIEVGVVCSTLGGARANDERSGRARAALQAKQEGSVGFVLATGTTKALDDTGNPALVDAVSAGSGLTAAAALAVLEDQIAVTLSGLLAWVHVTPARLVELVAARAVYQDITGNWRTPSGHVVVASPGYAGVIDDVLVATNEVFAAVGAPEEMRTVDRSDNRYLVLHEAPALAVFDPCFNVSVGVGTSP